jgi:hypothetical protein
LQYHAAVAIIVVYHCGDVNGEFEELVLRIVIVAFIDPDDAALQV